MEIQTRHRLKILNSKCEYVCAVDNLSKKLDYGDDIDCCLNKLFLASKLINRLECYNFPTESFTPNTDSQFYTLIDDTQNKGLTGTANFGIKLFVDGVLYTMSSNLVDTASTLIIDKLTELGVLVTYVLTGTEFLLVLTCNVSDINIIIKPDREPEILYVFENIVPGICEHTELVIASTNCIKDSDLREMYAVLDNLLS